MFAEQEYESWIRLPACIGRNCPEAGVGLEDAARSILQEWNRACLPTYGIGPLPLKRGERKPNSCCRGYSLYFQVLGFHTSVTQKVRFRLNCRGVSHSTPAVLHQTPKVRKRHSGPA